jgi:hypothetical protein
MITTLIDTKITTAHRLMDLYKDWVIVYQLTGYGEYEIRSIAYMLGMI